MTLAAHRAGSEPRFAAAHDHAGDPLRVFGRREQGSRGPDVRRDEVRRAQIGLGDELGQELPVARGDSRSSRRSDAPKPGRSTAKRRACSESEAHIGANAYTLSGQGLVRTTTGFCEPPLSAYRIRTPSMAPEADLQGCCRWHVEILSSRAALRACEHLAKSLVIRAPVPPSGRDFHRSGTLLAGVAKVRASSGHDDVLDLCHVAPGVRSGILWGAPGLARAHVRRVPVPPVVRRGDRLEFAVMLGGLAQQLGLGGDVRLPFPAREPGRDLLEEPAVAIRVAERRVRPVRAAFDRVEARDTRLQLAGVARLRS